MGQQEHNKENDADLVTREDVIQAIVENLLNDGVPLEQAIRHAKRLSGRHSLAEDIIPLSEVAYIDDDNELGVQLVTNSEAMHGALIDDTWYGTQELLRLHAFLTEHLNWLQSHDDESETPVKRTVHYISPAQAAQLTNIAERTWRQRARDGRISGAIKIGRRQWLLPRNTIIQSQQEKGTEDV